MKTNPALLGLVVVLSLATSLVISRKYRSWRVRLIMVIICVSVAVSLHLSFE